MDQQEANSRKNLETITFDENVRWDFNLSLSGHGKNVRLAMIDALKTHLNFLEGMLMEKDLLDMQRLDTVLITPDDTASDEDIYRRE